MEEASRSIPLGARSWRSAVDPPVAARAADARRGSRASNVASADELAALFAVIVTASRSNARPAAVASSPPDRGARHDRDASRTRDLGVRQPNTLPPDLGTRLLDLCHQARKDGRDGVVQVDDRELVAAIAAHAPAPVASSIAELDGYLARCRPADLALVLAAGRGVAAAIAEVERAHRLTIDATCQRFASATHTAFELKAILHGRLFVAQRGRAPKIVDYAGQGALENWLRVTAVRTFLELAQREARPREVHASDPPRSGDDLALDVVTPEDREAVAAAMAEAAKRLAPGDRHLLRQHLVAGLSIEQLGAVLGIDRATMARRLAGARDQLAADTRAALARRTVLAPDERDAVIGRVMRRFDVTVGPLPASA